MKLDKAAFFRNAIVAAAVMLPVGGAFAAQPAKGSTPDERPVAGCQITVTVHNTGTQSFTVNWDESKVKVEGGLWTSLANNSSEVVAAGGSKSITYGALFNCGANRRYQIHTVRGGSEATKYFPSDSTWTTDSTPTINISM